MGIGEKSPTAGKELEEGLFLQDSGKSNADSGAATPPEGSSSSGLRTVASPSIPLTSQVVFGSIRAQRRPQSKLTALQGIRQKLKTSKVPLVYFLLITAVSLSLLIAVIVLAVALSANVSSTTHEKIIYVQCDDGWITYKGKCYYLSDDIKPWNDSQKYCTEHNSSLAIIDNKEEYDFLTKMKGDSNRWIGLRNKGNGSGWVRADGKPYSQNFFQIEMIESADIQYVYLNHHGVKSGRERTPKKFVCQKTLIIQPA